MLENPPKLASFDHVDDNGDLIFLCDNMPLRVHIDDTLEQAIVSAKELATPNVAQNESQSGTQTTQTLPISQIQALIRAGMSTAHVAERYHISESQVRRFSASVETEKQYAIEQFLLVPAPKQSNLRTLADVIERTLAKAHIGMESVTWRATRRGLEPWHITAQFNTATRTIKAGWTWNMHDNTVACTNPSARLLLGETSMQTVSSEVENHNVFAGPYRDTIAMNFSLANEDLPGNSIRSARIERAVSQWEQSQEQTANETEQTNKTEANTQTENTAKSVESASLQQISNTHDLAESTHTNAQENSENTSLCQAQRQEPNADVAKTQKSKPTETKPQEAPIEASQPAANKAHKRHNGRSAIPSWDEILFGEG